MSDARITELEYAMEKIKWDVLGICETRRKNEEILEYPGYILYHTDSNHGIYGVGFLIKNHLKSSITSFKSYSDRVASLELALQDQDPLYLIQCYAPTEKCKEEELNEFYKTLEMAMETIHTKNLIMMGDFNHKT